jgi:hypothetical protein
MHEHLDLQLSGSPLTPPSTQSDVPSGTGSSAQPSAAGSSSTDVSGPMPTRPNPARAHQTPAQQPGPQIRQQLSQQQTTPPAGTSTPLHQMQLPAQPADEIAALRARIAELERGSAHGNQLPARATIPHQALVADPTAVNRIRANLSSAKDESKKLTLPILQPGHKVSALSLREFNFPSCLYPRPCHSKCIPFSFRGTYFVRLPGCTVLHHTVCQSAPLGRYSPCHIFISNTVSHVSFSNTPCCSHTS